MATTSDLSRGAFMRFNGELVQVLEYEHRTPGNLRAFYQVKMRNVRTGKLAENRFRAGEALDFVRVETKEFQFLYKEGDNYVLMENETYDQVYVDGVLFGDGEKFLKEGMNVTVSFDNTTPIAAEIPSSVELEVTYTEPGLQGDTATKTLKPATLETGAEIKVPLFVNIGEKIRVDTRTREYIERVK
jgi:elongation factor P